MTKHMEELLSNKQNTEIVARAWPILKEILTEQQLIMVSMGEDDGSKKLKGFACAYRALEAFQIAGTASIEHAVLNLE